MLIERPPIPEVIERALVAGELFDSAANQAVRITSDLGTDLTASYERRAMNPQDGAVLKAGDRDGQGIGFANWFPIEDSGQGTVVFNGPCYLSGGHSFITNQPFSVTIRDGRIAKIEGRAEAQRFQRWIDSYDNPNMRVIAHLGSGYDRRAGPPPKLVEADDRGSWESMYGGVVVAFGGNLGTSGGQNAALSQCDLVLLEASFFLDDRQIPRSGELLVEGLKD